MKREDAKALADAVGELNEDYLDLTKTLKNATDAAQSVKLLWRGKNDSLLIKVGMALIAFPDPTVSDIVGGLFVAAGTVQKGIRRHTVYVDDIPKTFQNTLRDIRNLKSKL